MYSLALVALGGAIGASARHMLGHWALKAFGPGYPYGTFAANVLGGFLMGVLVAWLAFKVSGGEHMRLFLGVGLLGGFTTFSAFSLDAVRMLEAKNYGQFIGYVGGSVALSIGALMLGLILARKVFAA